MKYRNWMKSIFECEHKVFIILFVFYFIGFIAGCLSESAKNVQAFDLVLNQKFSSLLFKNLLLLFLSFIFGYTPFGVPVVSFLLLYSGMCSGIISASATYLYDLKGAVISAVFFYLYYLLNLISLLFVSFSSIRLSLVVFNQFRKTDRGLLPSAYVGAHIWKFIFFTLITSLSCAYFTYFASIIIFKLF